MLADLNFWYVWPIGTALWLLLGWAEFGIVEGFAIKHADRIHITLSYWIYYCSTKCPLATIIIMMWCGMFLGGLFVHFWWHWCPPGSVSVG